MGAVTEERVLATADEMRREAPHAVSPSLLWVLASSACDAGGQEVVDMYRHAMVHAGVQPDGERLERCPKCGAELE